MKSMVERIDTNKFENDYRVVVIQHTTGQAHEYKNVTLSSYKRIIRWANRNYTSSYPNSDNYPGTTFNFTHHNGQY